MPITQYNSSVRQMSQSKFNSMKNASGKIPDLANQIVMTNSEDSNISCLRTEVVYDMASSDASKNWGYPNGIQGNVEITKDLTKYQYLDFVLTIYPVNSMNTGGWSGVYRLDLTTKKSGDNWCIAGYSSAYADWDGGIGNVNAETWNFVLYYNIVDKKLKWFIRFTNTSWNNDARCVISKIYGVLKTPSMIYTGDELFAGNGISIANGVISADNDANFAIYNLFSDAEKSVTSGSEIIYSVGKQLKKGKYYACVYGQVYMNTRMGFLQLTIDSQTNVVEAATNSISRIGVYGSNIVTLDNNGEHGIYLKLTAQSNSTITLQGYSTYGFALFRIGD